jgi:hypothetical protein
VVNTTPQALHTKKETWYSLYRRLDGPQGHPGQVWKISLHHLGFSPWTVQPIESHYTILAHAAVKCMGKYTGHTACDIGDMIFHSPLSLVLGLVPYKTGHCFISFTDISL